MQSSRHFEIVYLLMDRRRMTTAELARELEVSSRTIRRDIESLSAAGVPVYMTRGKNGGVHLLPNYVLDKSLVSESEQTEILSALSALRSTGALENDDTHERLARAFQRDTIDWIDIDFSFWGATPEYKQAFELIREAITTRRLLVFEYYDSAENTSVRTVEPVRLVFKESSWYLQAFCLKRMDWRTFKLFRMKWPGMKILADSFVVRSSPPSMDLPSRTDSQIDLKLLFDAASENRVREEFAPSSIFLQEDGRLLINLSTSLNVRTQYYLLSYGAALEVLEPASVRVWIKQQACSLIKKYSNDF